MIIKEDLLRLIKSLSMSEKRYFKLYVARNSKGESNHYIKLFDLIEQTGTIEKRTIQKSYGDENFIKRHYTVYKHRLYNQILNSLSAYHANSSIDDCLLESIRKAKILFDKTMFSDATKVLEKAKSLASKYEKFLLLLEIIRWQKKIIFASSIYENAGEKDLIMLFDEENSGIKKIINTNESWKQYGLLYLYYRINGAARNQEDMDKYKALIDVPILQNEELALSYEAKRDFYKTHANYFIAINDIEGSYLYSKKTLALMELYPHQIEEEPIKYVSIFYNLLVSTKSLKKYEELFDTIPRLKSMTKKFQLPLFIHLSSYHLEFSAYLETGQFKKAMLLLPEIEIFLKEQKNTNGFLELILTTEIALLHFGNGDYHKSLEHINLVLNNSKTSSSEEYYNFLKVFQLIVHFEKGNMELLPYVVKSVYRSLIQRNHLHKTESIFIRFIRTRLNNIRSVKDQVEAFKALKEELVKMGTDSMEARFLELFDIIAWLESKIENRPFEEILQKKSGYVLKE